MSRKKLHGNLLVPRKPKKTRRILPTPELPKKAPIEQPETKEPKPGIFWPKPCFLYEHSGTANLIEFIVRPPLVPKTQSDKAVVISPIGDAVVTLQKRGSVYSMALYDENRSDIILQRRITAPRKESYSVEQEPWKVLGEDFARKVSVYGQIKVIGLSETPNQSNAKEFVSGLLDSNSVGLHPETQFYVIEIKRNRDVLNDFS